MSDPKSAGDLKREYEEMGRDSDGLEEKLTEAIVRQHDEELKALLRGEVPANQWRPEMYARAVLAVVERERPPLTEVLREVANSGVSFEDPRVGYVEVQIDRVTWTELRALASSTTEEQKPYRPPWVDIPATVPKDGRERG